MLETLTKILLTVVVVAMGAGTVRWIWTQQIDLGATVKNFLRGSVEPDWIATRDAGNLYQEGRVVADVRGKVERKNGAVVFLRLVNVEALDTRKPVEHDRVILKVRRVGSVTGMLSLGLETLRNVWDHVECEIVP